MNDNLLNIENIVAGIEGKDLLKGLSLKIGSGETHVLLGPNGAGKSTLGLTVMGSPEYQVKSGKIYFDGTDITGLSADKRAKLGMFISFQNPLEIPGLTLSQFLRSAVRAHSEKPLKLMKFRNDMKSAMKLLNMNESYADRDLNVGFSGGEKKKTEILQLLMLNPRLAILDETDSGLDVDAVRVVSEGIRAYQKERNGALLIITHSTKILESLNIDKAHIIVKGKIVESGGKELIDEVNEKGFERFLEEVR